MAKIIKTQFLALSFRKLDLELPQEPKSQLTATPFLIYQYLGFEVANLSKMNGYF
jgi:hypothetical protein